MATKTTTTTADDRTDAETRVLARLLFLSKAEPLGKDSTEEARKARQEIWRSEQKSYLVQARRLRRLMTETDGVELMFEDSLTAAE